jgi:hypothetical protein
MTVRSPLDVLAIVFGLIAAGYYCGLRCNCRRHVSRSSFWLRLFRRRDGAPRSIATRIVDLAGTKWPSHRALVRLSPSEGEFQHIVD